VGKEGKPSLKFNHSLTVAICPDGREEGERVGVEKGKGKRTGGGP